MNQIGTKDLFFFSTAIIEHLHLDYPIAYWLEPASVIKMVLRRKMSDRCSVDKVCCSLNSNQHCSATLPPPTTRLLKGYRHRVPYY